MLACFLTTSADDRMLFAARQHLRFGLAVEAAADSGMLLFLQGFIPITICVLTRFSRFFGPMGSLPGLANSQSRPQCSQSVGKSHLSFRRLSIRWQSSRSSLASFPIPYPNFS